MSRSRCRRAAGIRIRFLEDARSVAEFRDEGRRILDRVGLGARADTVVSELSHGEQKQLELAIALATTPRMLLLDEPMAGLGTAECSGMIDLLKVLKTEVTILLSNTTWMPYSRSPTASRCWSMASGSRPDPRWSAIRNNDQVRIAYLGEGDA